MKRDIVEQLEFGCPSLPLGVFSGKDGTAAEVVMLEAAEEIKKLRAQLEEAEQSARRDAFREALEIVNTEVPYTSFGPSRSRQLKEFIVNRLKQKMEGA